MNSQLIVDYIGRKVAAGYSEETIRRYLLHKGLSAQATDELFRRYRVSQQAAKPADAPKLRRGTRLIRPKWPLRRLIKTIVVCVVIISMGVGAYIFITGHKPKPVVAATKPLTYVQQQTLDANTIAGAVSQYSQANSALPALLSVGPTSNVLVLCNASCDPASSSSVPLNAYKPSNVRLEPYTAGITPDDQTLYLIAGAACKNRATVGDPNPKPRAMVLFYATVSGTGLASHCVSL